jgi:anion-transporting  ArsA/GET3 family ATPase
MTTLVHVCCGVGGSGKTTLAAAMALSHARAGRRAVVLTIDPARRLADALGMDHLGNEPQRVPTEGHIHLHALMLDRKRTWDELIIGHAANEERAARLLENPYYRAVSTRLGGSHEYMAVEKLHQLVASGNWDVVVLDTPPARHVVDFFRAPERVQRLFERSVMQALLQRSDQGWLGAASSRALAVMYRLAGEQVLADIADFFALFSDLSAGFSKRHGEIHTLLHSHRTTYWLVADADAPMRSHVDEFLAVLTQRKMQFGGFLLNRSVAAAPALNDTEMPPVGTTAHHRASWDAALRALVRRQRGRHEHQQRQARALNQLAPDKPIHAVPELGDALQSIGALTKLADALP